jgi:hypothetical protein
MRHESSVTSLSWIPSEAVTGGTRVAFDAGFTHYDEPPPGDLGDIERLRAADGCMCCAYGKGAVGQSAWPVRWRRPGARRWCPPDEAAGGQLGQAGRVIVRGGRGEQRPVAPG